MAKDKCDKCDSTKSKTFWDFKDGTVLCDSCNEKHNESSNKRNKIISIIIASIIIIALIFFFYSFITFTPKNAEQKLSDSLATYKTCYLDNLVNLQKSTNIYSRQIGTNAVNLVNQYNIQILSSTGVFLQYSVSIENINTGHISECTVPLFGEINCPAESETGYKSGLNASCLNECNKGSVPEMDKQLCYSACGDLMAVIDKC